MPDSTKYDFKITLKAARVNAGYSQRDVESGTGYSRTTLTRWESGKASPKFKDLVRLCAFYGIPIELIKM